MKQIEAGRVHSLTGKPQSVAILTPCYDRRPHLQYVVSLMNTARKLQEYGVKHWAFFQCNTQIHFSRNNLVAQAWAAGFENLFFIDDDMSWEFQDFWMVLNAAPDVLGVAGRKKKEEEEYCYSAIDGQEIEEESVFGLPVCKVARVGTGFLRIRTDALRRAAKSFTPYLSGSVKPEENHYCRAFFDNRITDHIVSEDYYFCDRLQEAGEGVYIAPWISVGHWGDYEYTGNVLDYSIKKQKERG